ncbi:MAG: hypothetical protein M1833_005405 [Piccolia ochrophora]|nr:MAG: hypothetical protein M1833_005405 [Piccolia ochrophora]
MSKNKNTDILLAGALAAFTVDLLVYPLDTLKTRIQSPDYRKIYTTSTGAVSKRLLFKGLYQGVGSVIIATLPSSGAFFTTYEGVKSYLTAHNRSTSGHGSPLVPQPLIHATASAVAELVSCFILTPAEVLKQNAQMIRAPSHTSSQSYASTNATLVALRRFRRPTQLWRGYTALAARNLPFTAMQFPMFEHLRSKIIHHRGRSGAKPSLLEVGTVTGVSAGAAGALAAVITTPIDVVKTRIMLSATGETKSPHIIEESGHHGERRNVKQQKQSGWRVGVNVVQQEGFKGLWRGGALRGGWTALGSGLYLGVYESGRIYLGNQREGKHEGQSIV